MPSERPLEVSILDLLTAGLDLAFQDSRMQMTVQDR